MAMQGQLTLARRMMGPKVISTGTSLEKDFLRIINAKRCAQVYSILRGNQASILVPRFKWEFI